MSTAPVEKKIAPAAGKFVTFTRIIRVVRVVFITTMVYQTGFQNGMVHFAQDPVVVEEELVKFSLQIDPKEKIENHIHGTNSLVHQRVTSVGNRIITAAKDLTANHVSIAQAQLRALPSSATAEQRETIENELKKWEQACRRLKGNWTFVVRKSNDVNAFVTGFCPRKVFVFEGLLKTLQLTDDELAMIMGHELSHVILGHVDDETPYSAILLGTQLVLMAVVDPIGIFSFFFDAAVSQLRLYIEAGYSRQHETDADELGLLLTSLSCYDIRAGSTVHQKLAELSQHRHTKLEDTHPSSVERHKTLAKLAKDHEQDRKTNPKYSQYNRDCTTYRQALRNIGFGV